MCIIISFKMKNYKVYFYKNLLLKEQKMQIKEDK